VAPNFILASDGAFDALKFDLQTYFDSSHSVITTQIEELRIEFRGKIILIKVLSKGLINFSIK